MALPSNPDSSCQHLLVALHGWGANAQDLAPLASVFNLPSYQFIFPNAPFAHPQVPGGRAWYALETSDYQGLGESRQMLLDWILSLEKQTGVPLSRTVLSGFSQGGAMVLDVGIDLPVAALCVLSGYLHFKPEAEGEVTIPPILIIHGTQDMVVPVTAAQQARDELMGLGALVDYQEFEMGHEIPPPALAKVQQFLQALPI
ncbi:MAG: alpha/beta hydrolase [Microcystaceae cyanobacterium]